MSDFKNSQNRSAQPDQVGLLNQHVARVSTHYSVSNEHPSKPTGSANVYPRIRVRCWFPKPTPDATNCAVFPTGDASPKPTPSATLPYSKNVFFSKLHANRDAVAPCGLSVCFPHAA